MDRNKTLIIFAILLIFISAFHTYYNLVGFSPKGISGEAIFEDLREEKGPLSTKTKIIIATEWLLVILVMLYSLIKAKQKFQKDEKASETVIKNVHLVRSRNKTDIDLLYELLLTKKSIPFPAITKYFQVDKKIAMEWCQILEEGNLGTIRYPTVGDPRIVLNGYEEKQNEAKQKEKTN